MRILVINGPNLNLLGARRPEVYGHTTLGELEDLCRRWGADLGIEVSTFQSNHEGEIIDRLHGAIGSCDGIVINPGALAHYSYAIHDAIESTSIPTVEVHISDITAREPWRAQSVVAPACVTSVSGEGIKGYHTAITTLAGGDTGR